MTPERILLVTLIAVVAGLLLDRWRLAGRPIRWWRDPDLPGLERRLMIRFDRFENNTTFVVQGLHEDLDSLRTEIRNMARLPAETRIPGVVRFLQVVRWGMAVVALSVLALGLLVAYLSDQIMRVAG